MKILVNTFQSIYRSTCVPDVVIRSPPESYKQIKLCCLHVQPIHLQSQKSGNDQMQGSCKGTKTPLYHPRGRGGAEPSTSLVTDQRLM